MIRSNRVLLAAAVGALFASSAAVAQTYAIAVDAARNQHPISPLIYGVNFASQAALADLNSPLNRNGGNATSRYNWKENASNRAADWYYESIGNTSATPGENLDTFISTSKAGGAEPMITVPMLDWVAKLGVNRSKLASFSQAKYGAQTGNDKQWFPDAGNGILASTGKPITGNDPNDAHVANDTVMQQGGVQRLFNTWGGAANGGPKYYLLDNEHSLWHSTHRDVNPIGATMEQVRDKMIGYGAAVKNADPAAQVVGPEEWGWSGYFYSGYDQQWAKANNYAWPYPDRSAHANMDYMPWLLTELRNRELSTGRRLLDVFSLHYYPQGGEYSSDTTSAKQLLRNKSTRSLWDPNYTDTSWINAKVMLIPRMKSWVSTYYPGLKTALTEYSWGADDHINGATTQADVLGIFGREGLDMAARWQTPAATSPTYKAMKMYRNYDGNKSGFGDVSVSAVAPDPDNLSAFASLRSADGALTVMVINKNLSNTATVNLQLANFAAAATAQAWQLTRSNAITRIADPSVSNAVLTAAVPPQSVTLFVVPASGSAPTGSTTTPPKKRH